MFNENLLELTKENTNFRRVLYTGPFSQLVLMNIPSGEDIGEEIHATTDQILFFVAGESEAVLNGESQKVRENDAVFVPAGTKHNFKNTGNSNLKLYTVYSPPAHKDSTVHVTKKNAEAEEHY